VFATETVEIFRIHSLFGIVLLVFYLLVYWRYCKRLCFTSRCRSVE